MNKFYSDVPPLLLITDEDLFSAWFFESLPEDEMELLCDQSDMRLAGALESELV